MRRHHLRQFVFITLLSLCLALCLPGSVNARSADKPAEKNEIEQALTAIGSGSAADLKSRLFTNRLTVLDAAFRARAINALPAALRDQRLTQGRELRRAEMNLQRVLALHERPQSSAVEIFLLRDETAQAMLWRGSVLVLSAGLVNALSDAELSGIIAHELGHSYFMDEMAVAQQARDSRTMRTVELKCDAVAILSLKLLGHDPALYLIGLLKLQAVTSRKGRSSGSILQTHPEYGERALFYQRFIKSLR
jgi:Zn-dependent protease with chaperone function